MTDQLLNEHAHNVYSQTGEDGIIAHILDVIGDTDRWCVEFGAWDGLTLSNSANLIRNRGYSGILIEPDNERFALLQENYRGFPSVQVLKEFVGFAPSDSLDVLLEGTGVPVDFDFLSIDIDGNDYHVWQAMESFHPKVVCVEFNPTMPTELDWVQPANPKVRQGCSAAALVRLGDQKGYELACCTRWNAIFVDRERFGRLGIADNSLSALRRDLSGVTHMFTGYDGRVLLAGATGMPWHGIPIDERRMQQLPSLLRGHPSDYSSLRRRALDVYRLWRNAQQFARRRARARPR